MHADHVEPFDGSNTLVENMVCACQACNVAKLDGDAMTFLEQLHSDESLSPLDNRLRLYGYF
jgi:hypothetical protein